MFIIKLIILFLVFYLAARVFTFLFRRPTGETAIQGRPKVPPLDLSKEDIEDVDFKETEGDH